MNDDKKITRQEMVVKTGGSHIVEVDKKPEPTKSEKSSDKSPK